MSEKKGIIRRRSTGLQGYSEGFLERAMHAINNEDPVDPPKINRSRSQMRRPVYERPESIIKTSARDLMRMFVRGRSDVVPQPETVEEPIINQISVDPDAPTQELQS